MNSHDTEYDDLTVLKGIGPVRQQWLRETFDVRTYQDLAALSPEKVESQLHAEGRTASRSDIEAWLVQARELAITAGQPVAHEEPLTEEIAQKAPSLPHQKEEWRPLASFAVEFQSRTTGGQPEAYRTRVHHMETDTDATWPGLESEQLCTWMLDQMGEKARQRAAEVTPAKTKPAAAAPIQVTVTQARVFQPPMIERPTATGEANQPLQGMVNGNQPFTLEATFQLSEAPVADHAQQITYSAQFSVRMRPGHSALHLGDIEPVALVTGQSTYTARLSDVTLQPGTYALRVVILLKGMAMGLGFLEIPLLQVI